MGFNKDLHNYVVSVFIEAVWKSMFKYLKNYEIDKFENHKRSYRKYLFKIIDSKMCAVCPNLT